MSSYAQSIFIYVGNPLTWFSSWTNVIDLNFDFNRLNFYFNRLKNNNKFSWFLILIFNSPFQQSTKLVPGFNNYGGNLKFMPILPPTHTHSSLELRRLYLQTILIALPSYADSTSEPNYTCSEFLRATNILLPSCNH